MTDRATRVLLVDGQVEDTHWVEELMAELEENRFGGGWRHGVEIFPIGRLADAILILEDRTDGQQVDAVLLNPDLPDSAGLHTLIKLRTHAPEAPVVILADRDDPDLAVSMVRAGAQDFLVKTESDSVPLARALRLAVERGRVLRALRATSSHDELTGLPNRNRFASACGQDAATARRLGLAMAVVVIEVAGIDGISRQYGREEGQVALIEAAEALRQAVSTAHLPLGRTGLQQFGLCAIARSTAEVESLVAHVKQRFHLLLNKSNRGALSFGCGAAWLRDQDDAEDLLACAERVLCENMGENLLPIARHEHQIAANSPHSA